jgi:cyclic-di-GMP-binding biofilm dispersal mediator protein
MTDLAGKRVLVVGASGGIGRCIAEELTKRGSEVIGSTRSVEVADSESVSRWTQLDLAADESIASVLDVVDSGEISIDGVIVAAGVVGFGDVVDTPAVLANHMMRVNATGVIQLLAGLVPTLASSDGAFIVTMSGQIVETPMAGMTAYAASKSALHAWGIAAAREFRRLGVRLLDARPGHTESGLARRAIFGEAPSFPEGLSPRSVAVRIIDAIVDDERDLPAAAFTR